MNSPNMLLDSFKIALIKKDSKLAFSLIERLSLEQIKSLDLDTLLSLKEMIAQSIELLEKEKEELQSQMHKTKKIQKFLS
ncbi:5-formyltetrahydrofolate cyclo-ligase [Helicobacter pylori]|nr:5-formyltetrahydrofolate cyclo-ligase [Helicobacter pylori]